MSTTKASKKTVILNSGQVEKLINDIVITPPKWLAYQKQDIIFWAKNNYRCGFYWEPGLGKTFVASFLVGALLKKGMASRIFISCPAVAEKTWLGFLAFWGIPQELVFSFTKHEKKQDLADHHKIILCNFEKLPSSKPKAKNKLIVEYNKDTGLPEMRLVGKKTTSKKREIPKDIDLWIIDEAHYIKETSSKNWKFFKQNIKKSDKLLLLSGTPFPNKHSSCFSQLDLLAPGSLGDTLTAFRREYCYEKNKDYHIFEVWPNKYKDIEKLASSLCTFRLAKDLLDIPEMTYRDVHYPLSPLQSSAVNQLLRSKVVSHQQDRPILLKSVNVAFLMALQILSGYVNMKITEDGNQEETDIGAFIPENWGAEQAKTQVCADFKEGALIDKENTLLTLAESLCGAKAIIWVNFTHTAQRVAEVLSTAGYKVDYFTANNKKNFEERITNFVQGDVQFLVSHPKIIGISVNYFTPITRVIWYELTYDWAVYTQANDRIYRKGQQCKTFCYHFLGHNLEKRQLEALRNKEDVHTAFAEYLDNPQEVLEGF